MRTLEKAQAEIVLGRFDQARRTIADYIQSGLRGYDLVELATLLNRITDDRELLEITGRLALDVGDEFAAAMAQGVLAESAGDPERALDRWATARAANPGHPDPLLCMGRTLFGLGRIESALALFRVTARSPVDAPDSAWNAALCQSLLNRPEPAGEMRIQIFAAYHKPYALPGLPLFVPIQVGRARAATRFDMIGDDRGDNISHRNDVYCELTAQYWAWKNRPDLTHVGFCHYRRYPWFWLEHAFPYKFSVPYANYSVPRRLASLYRHCLDEPLAMSLIAGHDVLVPRPTRLAGTVREQWAEHHPPEMLNALERLIALRSAEDGRAAQAFFEDRLLTPFNMMIMRDAVFREWAEWLFDLLFAFEDVHVGLRGAPMPPRMAGYMGERLLGIFLRRKREQGLRILEIPMVSLM
ncbi:MAG: DUF4422 domain-containing protein [Alphaproteobacteria bacterium]|nr:DUF4422 domain-containing protein [Alphaproteobacteria bacterium]